MKWVLIDLSYLAHRARHSLKELSYGDFNTGILFGFFEQLRTICFDPLVQSNKVLIFCDSQKSHRKTLYPTYKEKRHKDRTEEELEQIKAMHEQADLLRYEVLPEIGIPVYRQVGLESDDLIAAAAVRIICRHEEGIIISSDGDLYQCISPLIEWYDPGRRTHYNHHTFERKFGIGPNYWSNVKILAGCSTDEVKGIPGVAEKTAIKYIKGELPEHYKSHKAIHSKEGIEIRKRNFKLVHLPHAKTKQIQLKEPEYNPDAFFKWAEKFGISTYLDKRRGEWLRLFNGRFAVKPELRRRNGNTLL